MSGYAMSAQASAAREVRLLVLHCSATPNDRTLFSGKPGTPGYRTPVDEIDLWHQQAGFRRDTYWRGRQNAGLAHIGYHFVISRNGALFTGRHLDEVGAHAAGWNKTSVGLCLVGTDRYTREQWETLASTVSSLAKLHEIPIAPPELSVQGKKGVVVRPGVCGHRDLPGHSKSCPGFAVRDWMKADMATLQEHLA